MVFWTIAFLNQTRERSLIDKTRMRDYESLCKATHKAL